MAVSINPSRVLTSVGEVSYNEFNFPAPLKSSISMEAIYDQANRTIKYYRVTIKLEVIILNGDDGQVSGTCEPTDNDMVTIRDKLSEPGGKLTFNAQGWGNTFVVNDPSLPSTHDLAYGPQPQVLNWEPIGSNKACRIVWTVRAHVPFCKDTTPPRSQAFIDWNEDYEWQISDKGYTTRVITGSYEIPISRLGHATTDTADNYRSFVGRAYSLLAGFKRSQSWRLSRDKRTMEFKIVDTEIESSSVYPPQVVDMSVNHTIDSRLGADPSSLQGTGFRSWSTSLDCSITLHKEASPIWAWIIFTKLIERKLRLIGSGTVDSLDSIGNNRTTPAKYIPIALKVSESIYEKKYSFNFDYLVYHSIKLNSLQLFSRLDLLQDDGANIGFTDSDWVRSMQVPYDPRGNAQQIHAKDTIVDLCLNGSPSESGIHFQLPRFGEGTSLFYPGKPNRRDSWLDCKIFFDLSEYPNSVVTSYAQATDASFVETQNIDHDKDGTGNEPPINDTNRGTGEDTHTTQVLGKTGTYVTMSGWITRIGYKPGPVPKMLTYAGNKVFKMHSKSSTGLVSASGSVPVYKMVFAVSYSLTSVVSGRLDQTKISHTAELCDTTITQ